MRWKNSRLVKRNLVLRLNLHLHRNIKNKCCNFRRCRRWTACKNGKQGGKITIFQQKRMIIANSSNLTGCRSKLVKILKDNVKNGHKMRLNDIIEWLRKCSLRHPWCQNAKTFWPTRRFRVVRMFSQELSIKREMLTTGGPRLSKTSRIVRRKLLTKSWTRWKIH